MKKTCWQKLGACQVLPGSLPGAQPDQAEAEGGRVDRCLGWLMWSASAVSVHA